MALTLHLFTAHRILTVTILALWLPHPGNAQVRLRVVQKHVTKLGEGVQPCIYRVIGMGGGTLHFTYYPPYIQITAKALRDGGWPRVIKVPSGRVVPLGNSLT